MRKLFCAAFALVVCAWAAEDALAIKTFQDAWNKYYLEGEGKMGDLKDQVAEAKCNVCHVQGEKKTVHNAYGKTLVELLDKDNYKAARVKAQPEEVQKELEEAFKKVEGLKGPGDMTFKQRMEKGMLPGGDKEGKLPEGDKSGK